MGVLAHDVASDRSTTDLGLSRFQRQVIAAALLDGERVLAAAATELKVCGRRVFAAPGAGAMVVTDRRLLVVDPDSTRAADAVITVPFDEIEQIAYLQSMTGRTVIVCTRQGRYAGKVRRELEPAEDLVATLQEQITGPGYVSR